MRCRRNDAHHKLSLQIRTTSWMAGECWTTIARHWETRGGMCEWWNAVQSEKGVMVDCSRQGRKTGIQNLTITVGGNATHHVDCLSAKERGLMSKHEAFTNCGFDVGPASQTLAQHRTHNELTPRGGSWRSPARSYGVIDSLLVEDSLVSPRAVLVSPWTTAFACDRSRWLLPPHPRTARR